MRYYPVFLDIHNRSCLVVGGGRVGTRKVASLLECGARVTVVSPQVTNKLNELAGQGRIVLKRRAFLETDLKDAFLVFGATDDRTLNRRLHREAEKRRRLCNIADQPELCSFVLPAVVRQGDLSIAVSTAGKSPAFARHLRSQMEAMFGPEYGQFLDLMGAIREKLLVHEHAPQDHKSLFDRLIGSDLLEMIRQADHRGINTLLKQVLGPDYGYEDLMKTR